MIMEVCRSLETAVVVLLLSTALRAQDSSLFTKVLGEPMTIGGGAQGISWGDCNGDGSDRPQEWMAHDVRSSRVPASLPE